MTAGLLDGKVVLVTGASSGLGRHFATVLAAAGAKVVLGARRLQKLESLAAEIAENGGHAYPVRMDVNDRASVTAALGDAAEEVGAISVLINNAGVAAGGAALDVTDEDWRKVLDTNIDGAWIVAQETARRMRDVGGGAIVNTASILGFRQAGGVAPYAVSKAAIVQMTKSLALELARFQIRVNAIAPGYIETDLNSVFLKSPAGEAMMKRIPMRRFGTLHDLDGPLLLLASDASSYMTGSVIAVDGGHLVSSL